MNKKSSVIAAIIVLAAAGARATELNWNQDVVGQFKAQMKELKAVVPSAKAVAIESEQPQADAIEAQALGSAVINHRGNDWDEQISLTLNNDGDRVGAEYMTCDPATEHSTEYNATCEYASFRFPQLTVQGKNIYWGSELVAKVHHGIFTDSVKLEKGFRLKASKVDALIDRGFDRDHVNRVSVVLVKESR